MGIKFNLIILNIQNFNKYQNHLQNLLKQEFMTQYVWSGTKKNLISNKFPGDEDADRLETTL